MSRPLDVEGALDRVSAAAAEYFVLKNQTDDARDYLFQTMREAKGDFPSITQEQLADRTDFSSQLEDEDARLSRQRVQQVLAGRA